MAEKTSITETSVHHHLSLLQDVIGRMNTNSANCKTWCITLIAGMLVVLAEKENWHALWLLVVPALLFSLLDAYYLALERAYREHYDETVTKLHAGTLEVRDLLVLSLRGRRPDRPAALAAAALSPSIALFYGLLLVATLLLWRILGK